MKSKAFLLLCSILSISLTSCNKDDTKQTYSYSYDLISMKNNVSFTNGKGFSPLLVSTDELDHYLNTTLSLIVLVRNENFEKTYEIQTTINTNISNYVGTYSDILYQINQDVIYDDIVKYHDNFGDDIYYNYTEENKEISELKTCYLIFKNGEFSSYIPYTKDNEDLFNSVEPLHNLYSDNFEQKNAKIYLSQTTINSTSNFNNDYTTQNPLNFTLGINYSSNTVIEVETTSFINDNVTVVFADLSKQENISYLHNTIIPSYQKITNIPMLICDISIAKYTYKNGHLGISLNTEKYKTFLNMYSMYYKDSDDINIYCKKANQRIQKEDEVLKLSSKSNIDNLYKYVQSSYTN